MIKIYIADVSNCDPRLYIHNISLARRNKIQRYLKDSDKTLSVGAELLLNIALKELRPEQKLPIEYSVDTNGKPFIEGDPLYFNLSHSGAMAACVLSDREVGIDIQQEKIKTPAVARRFFCESEYEAIEHSGGKLFWEYWVLKESYMKARGLGFKLPMDRFCIHIFDEITVEEDGAEMPYHFWQTRMGDYHLAVCVSGKIEEDEMTLQMVDITKTV